MNFILTFPNACYRISQRQNYGIRQKIFKDGRFRWNRLENCNACNSQDYLFLSQALNQALDFLFPNGGAFIRTT